MAGKISVKLRDRPRQKNTTFLTKNNELTMCVLRGTNGALGTTRISAPMFSCLPKQADCKYQITNTNEFVFDPFVSVIGGQIGIQLIWSCHSFIMRCSSWTPFFCHPLPSFLPRSLTPRRPILSPRVIQVHVCCRLSCQPVHVCAVI